MHIKTSNQEKLDVGFRDYTCNWGLHICWLFETDTERDEILFGFALRSDLRLYYCPSKKNQYRICK